MQHESNADYEKRLLAAARSTLRQLLEPGQKLQRLLAHPEFAALRDRVQKLANDLPLHVAESPQGEQERKDQERKEKHRFDELVGLLDEWSKI